MMAVVAVMSMATIANAEGGQFGRSKIYDIGNASYQDTTSMKCMDMPCCKGMKMTAEECAKMPCCKNMKMEDGACMKMMGNGKADCCAKK